MNGDRAAARTAIPTWLIVLVAAAALVIATAALTPTLLGRGPSPVAAGMMGVGSQLTGRAGMMGSAGGAVSGVQPGEAGFVAGTVASPRVIRIYAGPGYAFSPSAISVARGETVTFQVTTMGPLVHEFKVGPADAVAADQPGTPEVADIGMMQTKSLTYTFDGTGSYAFACHATGHYEAGMRGTITVVE